MNNQYSSTVFETHINIMKKSIIALFAAVAMLSGCSLDVDSITPAAQAVIDPGFGGTIQFAVWASGPWTAYVNADTAFGVTMEPLSGPEGETLITVTIPENLTTDDRAANLQFTCGKAATCTSVYQYRPYMFVDESYIAYAAKMKDGNWWTVENYGFLPEGKSLSKSDFSTNTGVWLPCETVVASDGTVEVSPSINSNTIDKQGYFFTPEQYLNNEDGDDWRGVCSEGWHVATGGEWLELFCQYGNKETGEAELAALNNDNFNFYPYQYVIDGESYSDEVLNLKSDSLFKNMASIGMYGSSVYWDDDNILAAVIHNTEERTYVSLEPVSKNNGMNVRCVRDKEQPE